MKKNENKRTETKKQILKNPSDPVMALLQNDVEKITFDKFDNMLHYKHSDVQQVVRLSILIGFIYNDFLCETKQNKDEALSSLDKLDDVIIDRDHLKEFLKSVYTGIFTLENLKNK